EHPDHEPPTWPTTWTQQHPTPPMDAKRDDQESSEQSADDWSLQDQELIREDPSGADEPGSQVQLVHAALNAYEAWWGNMNCRDENPELGNVPADAFVESTDDVHLTLPPYSTPPGYESLGMDPDDEDFVTVQELRPDDPRWDQLPACPEPSVGDPPKEWVTYLLASASPVR
ncbi:hypothetical protein, partial [Arthrobacter sp. Leaf141]|uniref:hypothetical protein n=1 Tax=Arthrobacter sp. Leaf141 TaxID=1736273 RepID=UPI000A55A50B